MAKVSANPTSSKETSNPGPAPLSWHFLQCFGQPNAAEQAPNADLLSALKFNHTGEFLATGDKGGRIVLLQQQTANFQQRQNQAPQDGEWMFPMEFHYLSEFQAHHPDFDYLKSIEIPERINSISWLHNCGNTHMLLSANDKQVKLWKIYDKTILDIANYNHSPNNGTGLLAPNGTSTFGPSIASGHGLKIPSVVGRTRSLEANCKRAFDVNAHLYFINSVSMCADQATFISSDDLTLHLWNLERVDGHQVVLDVRPQEPVDYSQSLHVITSASCHPTNSDLIGYSTSKVALSMIDLRQKDVKGLSTVSFCHAPALAGAANSFAEPLAAASSHEFCRNGIHAVTRDYMHAALWDIRNDRQPVRIFQVQPHLWDRLNEMYENEYMYDRLGCALSPNGEHIVAGTYGELGVYNASLDHFSLLKTCVQPQALNGLQMRPAEAVNFRWKVENIAWHPTHDLIVATALNSLFTFCARPQPL